MQQKKAAKPAPVPVTDRLSRVAVEWSERDSRWAPDYRGFAYGRHTHQRPASL